MKIFEYGQKEIDYLKKKDKKLALAIDKIGILEREITTDPFKALIFSVVSQQISGKAAETVTKRLINLVGDITPERIFETDLSDIQKCGMSTKKSEYIKEIANASISGNIDFNELYKLADEEIIKKLSSLRGVGVWTSEMILIFSLCRPNVLSYNDLAIRRGMMNLYGLSELSKIDFEKYRKRYSPYGSIASLYLWELSVK